MNQDRSDLDACVVKVWFNLLRLTLRKKNYVNCKIGLADLADLGFGIAKNESPEAVSKFPQSVSSESTKSWKTMTY